MNRAIITTTILLISQAFCLAQERSFTTLELTITATKRIQKTEKGDSLFTFFRENPLITKPGTYLRAYGPSGSHGLSLQGAAPAHTDISWNGIPFNNAMLGQADASLIPATLLENSTIRLGGISEPSSCASFGGSLNLGSLAEKSPLKSEFGFSAGSFSRLEQWLSIGGSKGRATGSLRAWNNSAQWDFPYSIEGYKLRQSHSARQFKGAEGMASIELCKSSKLEAGFWSQNSYREIPGAILETDAQASQIDQNNRLFLRYRRNRSYSDFNAMAGFSKDFLGFEDPKSGIQSRTTIQGAYFQTDGQYWKGSHSIRISAHSSQNTAKSSAFDSEKTQTKAGIGVSGNLSFFKNTILVRPEFRIESWHFSSSDKAQFAGLPSILSCIQINKNQRIELGFHGKLRNPGLNDLYWPGAGNPSLQSEKGFTSNLDWKYVSNKTANSKVALHVGVYESRIHNYILWQPNFALWKPSNIGSVILRGLVFNPEFSCQTNSGFTFSANLETRISAQTILKTNVDGPQTKPLPFSPNFQASTFFKASFKKFSSFVRLFYCGSRTTDSEGLQKLLPYQLVDSGIEFQASEESGLHFFGSISNMFNARYTQMPGYPMPGRNFNAGMKINF